MTDIFDDEILNAPVVFGLAAQGHIPTVERMLAEGRSWDEIGDVIGWCGNAVERFWGYHLSSVERAKAAGLPLSPVKSDGPSPK